MPEPITVKLGACIMPHKHILTRNRKSGPSQIPTLQPFKFLMQNLNIA
jgi:hypothetical protein